MVLGVWDDFSISTTIMRDNCSFGGPNFSTAKNRTNVIHQLPTDFEHLDFTVKISPFSLIIASSALTTLVMKIVFHSKQIELF